VQNIGLTSSESSYIMGRPENKEDSAITKRIFQQEIINMRNSGGGSSNRSSSSSREGSVEASGNLNQGSGSINRNQRQSSNEGSPTKRVMGAAISNSNSSTSLQSTGRGTSPEKNNSNISNVTSPISIQNFFNKFNTKDKSPSPSGRSESKSLLGRLGDIKNSLANNNNRVRIDCLWGKE
jgi:hypothetical protein